MATEDDDLDKTALMDQLDPTKAPVSTTMPVKDPTTPPAATTLPATPVAPARTPTQASIFQGFQPKYAMEGFDTQREQNTGKSAKDAFAYLSQQAPPPPINDKAKLGEWFSTYIKPGMNDLGHNITSVEGDKFGFKNWQGDFNVDYGRGAGAEGGALAWQVDDPSARLASGPYVPKQPSAADAALAKAIGIGGGDQGATPQDQLKQEIQALVEGGNSPMDEKALMEQLQV